MICAAQQKTWLKLQRIHAGFQTRLCLQLGDNDIDPAKRSMLPDQHIVENYTNCDSYAPTEREKFGILVTQRYCQRQFEDGSEYDLEITRFDSEGDRFLKVLREFEDGCFDGGDY